MKVLLAIPVFNEKQTVAEVISEARKFVPDVLVIDDGSDDGTSEVLDTVEGIRRINHEVNLGYGQGLIDAFAYAEAHGYDWVITMDCDWQHEPAQLTDFLDAVAADDADIISGSRYLLAEAGGDSPPIERRTINAEITHLLNETLHLGITDAFCGFKAYRVEAVASLHVTEPGYAMPLELWVRAARHNLRIREIPVRLIYNDPNRSFGGRLDDAEFRRRHYLKVFHETLADQPAAPCCGCGQSRGCS